MSTAVARPRPKHSRPNSAVYIGTDPLLHKLASTPPGIPDLPEPPEPELEGESESLDYFERDGKEREREDAYADESESDRESGLPSPPATNSTGSGSTGDPASIALRGSGNNRRRIVAAKRTSTSSMLNEANVKTFHKAFNMDDDNHDSSNVQQQNQYDLGMDDDDPDIDQDDGEEGEHTAKLLRRHSIRSSSTTSGSENSQTLERVKSLTERNRLALDKLSSISRLSSPSPKPTTPASRPSTSSSSGTRNSRLGNNTTYQNATPDRSGSETERESVRGESQTRSRHSLSPDMPTTHLPSTNRPGTPRTTRTRLISAPASPAKALQLRAANSSSSSASSHIQGYVPGSPSNSPNKARKRASMPMSDLADLRNASVSGRRFRSPSPDGYGDYPYETPSRSRADDIAARALEAVASSRRGVGAGSSAAGRTRQPLPREFREASASSTASSSRGDGASVSRRSSVSSRYEDEDEHQERENTGSRRVNGRYSTEPTTPHRDRSHMSRPSLNLSPRLQRNLNNSLGLSADSLRDRDRATIGRSSTLGTSSITNANTNTNTAGRRQGQGHQAWFSEDMSVSSVSASRDGDYEDDLTGPSPHTATATRPGPGPGVPGRKPTVRGTGSADSALTMTVATPANANAAGSRAVSGSKTLGRRAGRGVDVFDDTPLRDRERDRERDRDRAGSRLGGERSLSRTQSRSRSRIGWEDEVGVEDDAYEDDGYDERSRSRLERDRELRTRAGTIVGPRASTSMADYREYRERERDGIGVRDRERERESSIVRLNGRGDEPMTAPPQLRSYNSAYPLPLGRGLERREGDRDRERERDRERAPSALSSNHTKTPSSRNDHLKLLHESLRLFESNVSRMPSTTSSSIGDLLRNAQLIVSASERLGVWLRESNQHALENQIDAEVEVGSANATSADAIAEVWRKVGGEYRDGIRISDELVRGVTDFLLGVGRAVKDMNPGPVEHGRSVSLDEVVAMTRARSRADRDSMSPEGILDRAGSAGEGRAGSGRGSTGTGSAGSRPASAFNLRDRERERDRDREERYETPPARAGSRQAHATLNGITPSTGGSSTSSSSVSVGRVRQLATFDSQETVHAHGYEPSPTPAPRGSQNNNSSSNRSGAGLDRSRTLPPLSIPKPLGTLPSETPQTSRRLPDNTSSSSSKTSASVARRRTTPGHSATVRGPPSFPGLSTPNLPTTQLTTHTASSTREPISSTSSGSRDKLAFPLVRSDSEKSGGSGGGNPRSTVTFSRSSTVSVNALTQLQQDERDRKRTGTRARAESGASASGGDDDPRPSGSGSGPRIIRSDTEDFSRRRQTGTLGRQIRMSLDGSIGREAGLNNMGMGVSVSSTASTVHPADRSAALTSTAPRKERRGTVVDLWPRGS
ncbi:hypothetical protein VKT23_007937 [Stygiomarasmius scandens]|uniref:Uncharacterized protein n=1 Tax=Marasmiellus scandens TaxID=2682957 RepID=A0ABR1JP98_9AGAR